MLWLPGCDDEQPVCAVTAVANHLLAATGIAASDAEMLAHLPRPLYGLMDDAFKFARGELSAVDFLFACKAFVMNVRDAQVACAECDGLSRTWKEFNCPACGNRGWQWRD